MGQRVAIASGAAPGPSSDGPGSRTRRRLSTRLALALLVSLPAALVVALVVVAVEGSWGPLHRVDSSGHKGYTAKPSAIRCGYGL